VLEQTQLTSFDLGYCEVGEGELRELLRARFARGLTSLRIPGNPLGGDAWRAFHELPGANLRQLDVSGTAVAAEGLASLLGAPCLAGLTALSLDADNETDDREQRDLEAVARSPFWQQAEELRLHDIFCTGPLLDPLCRASGPRGLRILDLGDTALRTEGVRRLCAAPFADSLVWLDLCRNYLDDEALAALADSGRFRRLRQLDLRTNGPQLAGHTGERITDAGVERLAAAPSLARLRRLNLHATAISARGVDALLNGPHWKLSGLDVGGCDLSPDVVPVLAKSPRLARLTDLSLGFNPRLKGKALLPLAESPYLSSLCRLAVNGPSLGGAVNDLLRQRLGRRLNAYSW
jgi:hypothetical protein